MKDLKITQALKQIRQSLTTLGKQLDLMRKGLFSIKYVDALLSGLAIYQLKIPSLLQYDMKRNDSRMLGLFGITQAPSDTHLREMLDEVDPEFLRPTFKDFFYFLRHNRHLETFKCFGKYYALSVDATQYFCSKDIHCKNCLETHHKNGSITYSHQMLAGSIVKPGIKEVVPVCPEPIVRKDGRTKNDCELNAFYRFYKKFREDHPKLPCIFLMDGLFSKAPVLRTLQRHTLSHYIIGAKPGDHKYLFEWVSRQDFEELSTEQENRDIHHYQYCNNAPLNETNSDIRVNFLHVHVERPGKKKDMVFSFVTDFKITKENVNELTALGRARWKIENETFNTLKNQGYNFEHNYGHGYKYLSTVLAMLMMLAFACDQFQQMTCPIFQQVLEKAGARYILWEQLRIFFHTILKLTSWEQIYAAMLHGVIPAFDTS